MVGSIVVVSSVQVVKPHSRLAGFALVGVPARYYVHDLIKRAWPYSRRGLKISRVLSIVILT